MMSARQVDVALWSKQTFRSLDVTGLVTYHWPVACVVLIRCGFCGRIG